MGRVAKMSKQADFLKQKSNVSAKKNASLKAKLSLKPLTTQTTSPSRWLVQKWVTFLPTKCVSQPYYLLGLVNRQFFSWCKPCWPQSYNTHPPVEVVFSNPTITSPTFYCDANNNVEDDDLSQYLGVEHISNFTKNIVPRVGSHMRLRDETSRWDHLRSISSRHPDLGISRDHYICTMYVLSK